MVDIPSQVPYPRAGVDLGLEGDHATDAMRAMKMQLLALLMQLAKLNPTKKSKQVLAGDVFISLELTGRVSGIRPSKRLFHISDGVDTSGKKKKADQMLTQLCELGRKIPEMVGSRIQVAYENYKPLYDDVPRNKFNRHTVGIPRFSLRMKLLLMLPRNSRSLGSRPPNLRTTNEWRPHPENPRTI